MGEKRKIKLRPMTIFQAVLILFLITCLVLLVRLRTELNRLEQSRDDAKTKISQLQKTVDELQDRANKALDGDQQALEDWLIQNGYRPVQQ